MEFFTGRVREKAQKHIIVQRNKTEEGMADFSVWADYPSLRGSNRKPLCRIKCCPPIFDCMLAFSKAKTES